MDGEELRVHEERRLRSKPRTVYHAPNDSTGDHSNALSLTVLFTTVPGTLNALRKAAQLAYELQAGIRILVPHVVPYPLALNEPRVNPEFRLRHFRALCEQERIDTRLDVRLCRDARECIHAVLFPHSLVVIGGRQRQWPLSYEKRLVRSLTKAGHEVISVRDCGRR